MFAGVLESTWGRCLPPPFSCNLQSGRPQHAKFRETVFAAVHSLTISIVYQYLDIVRGLLRTSIIHIQVLRNSIWPCIHSSRKRSSPPAFMDNDVTGNVFLWERPGAATPGSVNPYLAYFVTTKAAPKPLAPPAEAATAKRGLEEPRGTGRLRGVSGHNLGGGAQRGGGVHRDPRRGRAAADGGGTGLPR